VESGMIQREIQESAFRAQQAVESGAATVVGVTRFQTEATPSIPTFQIDPEIESRQRRRLAEVRARRDAARWKAALETVKQAATADTNLVPPIIAAVKADATIGEISDALRTVFGEHRESFTA
jgi:methylmalonyl-CoA mutase N-terminal domain/subunit